MPSTLQSPPHPDPGGVLIASPDPAGTAVALEAAQRLLADLGLRTAAHCEVRGEAAPFIHAALTPGFAASYLPEHDTTGVARALSLRTDADDADLDREIMLAMLASPVAFDFPSVAELESAVRIRRYIVRAAGKTALAFDTEHAERPEDYWTYDEARGFTILPGRSLIDGLRKATQPEASGQLYAFSCYRATEYVTVLGIAQELREANPEPGDGIDRHRRRQCPGCAKARHPVRRLGRLSRHQRQRQDLLRALPAQDPHAGGAEARSRLFLHLHPHR